jgi:site-specific DNA-methyltransferase (adenine-specific)
MDRSDPPTAKESVTTGFLERPKAHPAYEILLGDCLNILPDIAKESVDVVWTDPPYFLSTEKGTTCKNGNRVKVNKGTWDESKGLEEDHEFHTAWLSGCQRVLKPDGTIWVTATHHTLFSIGYAMQELGFKILNLIAWEKPNPPPNLSCRYFTHSTEMLIWAARDEHSKHTFNYADMRAENGGKQMKTVWRFKAPSKEERVYGSHPTQKPLALVSRALRASSAPGDVVLDPFCGSGTTGVAAVSLGRKFIGIEKDSAYRQLAWERMKAAPAPTPTGCTLRQRASA